MTSFLDSGELQRKTSRTEKHKWINRQVCAVAAKTIHGLVNFGTGTLVAPDLILTSDHVLKSIFSQGVQPSDLRFRFDLTGDAQIQERCYQPHNFWEALRSSAEGRNQHGQLAAPRDNQLDFAIIRLQPNKTTQHESVYPSDDLFQDERRGFMNIDGASRPIEGEPVYILGFPEGQETLQFTGKNASGKFLTSPLSRRIYYDVPTDYGFSGGLVLDKDYNPVAIHQAAQIKREDGTFVRQGVPLYNIVKLCRRHGVSLRNDSITFRQKEKLSNKILRLYEQKENQKHFFELLKNHLNIRFDLETSGSFENGVSQVIETLSQSSRINKLCRHLIESNLENYSLKRELELILKTTKTRKKYTTNPFVGLRAMDEDDQHIFYGRDEEILDLINRFEQTNLIAIVADSGSGKSSLVKAGLIPKYRAGHLTKDIHSDDLNVIVMRPSANPEIELKNAVEREARIKDLPENKVTEFRNMVSLSNLDETARACRLGVDPQKTETLLIVDQFEEIFTMRSRESRESEKDERYPLIDFLLGLQKNHKTYSFKILLTIRSDYFALCRGHETLHNYLMNTKGAHFPLKSITLNGIRECIEHPLERAKYDYYPDIHEITQDIIKQLRLKEGSDYLNRPGDLSQVQFAMSETWLQFVQDFRDNEDDASLANAYRKVGRVLGALPLKADKYTKQYQRSSEKVKILEAIFSRLINPGESGGATRRVAKGSEFSEEALALCKTLASQEGGRILQISGSIDPSRMARPNEGNYDNFEIEVSHESLMTQWSWLQNFNFENAEDVRSLHRVIEDVEIWPRGQLRGLATGISLKSAEGLFKRLPHWFSTLEERYLNRSRFLNQAIRMASTMAGIIIITLTAFLFFQLQESIRQKKATYIALAESTAFQKRPLDASLYSYAGWPSGEAKKDATGFAHVRSAIAALSLPVSYPIHERPGSIVWGATSSPDNKTILIWWNSGELYFVDAITGSIIKGPLLEHTDGILGAEFSKDGNQILTWSADSNLVLWDAKTGVVLKKMEKHKELIAHAEFSHDGELILSQDSNTVLLWNGRTGEFIREMEKDVYKSPFLTRTNYIAGATFSPDNKKILTWSHNHRLTLTDVETGKIIGKPLEGHTGPIFRAKFSPDGSIIATGSFDSSIRLWDAKTGEMHGEPYLGHKNSIDGMIFSRDGENIISWADDDSLVHFWSLDSRQALIQPLTVTSQSIEGVMELPESDEVLSWSSNGKLTIWDGETGDMKWDLDDSHDARISEVILSPDEEHFLSLSDDKTLKLWDIETMRPIGPVLAGHADDIFGAIFNPVKNQIISWSADGDLRAWKINVSNELGVALLRDEERRYVRIEPHINSNNNTIVFGTQYGMLKVWDSNSGDELHEFSTYNGLTVDGIIVSKDGTKAVSWNNNSTYPIQIDSILTLWTDFPSQPGAVRLMEGAEYIYGATFTKDDKKLITWAGSTLSIWDASSGKRIGDTLIGHTDEVRNAVYYPNSDKVLSWSNNEVLIWDTNSGVQIGPEIKSQNLFIESASLDESSNRILLLDTKGTPSLWSSETGDQTWNAQRNIDSFVTNPENHISGAKFIQSGQKLMVWSEDGIIGFVNSETGVAEDIELLGHAQSVKGAIYNADKGQILSWSNDQTLRIWDLETKQMIGKLEHSGGINGGTYAFGGKIIISWARDQRIKLWDAKSFKLIGTLEGHRNGVSGVKYLENTKGLISWDQKGNVLLWKIPFLQTEIKQKICENYPQHTIDEGLVFLEISEAITCH